MSTYNLQLGTEETILHYKTDNFYCTKIGGNLSLDVLQNKVDGMKSNWWMKCFGNRRKSIVRLLMSGEHSGQQSNKGCSNERYNEL